MARRDKRPIFGKGINDADYAVQKEERYVDEQGDTKRKVVWRCPYFDRWFSMLRRCYSDRQHKRQPTYKGCYVCEDWLLFSNFKSWMEKQDWEGYHLDKDILGCGKEYSPDKCVFVPPKVNTFLLSSKAVRGDYPIGVSAKNNGEFSSQVKNLNNKCIYLGSFSNPESAYNAWLKEKLKLANTLCDQYNLPDSIRTAIKEKILELR